MSEPSVTVAISTYEPDELLERALESVAAQEYDGPVDAVVVETSERKQAASTVESFPFASYHWQLDHFPRQESSMGNIGISRDLGVSFAEGSYVHFLDDDDELGPDAIAKKVTALQAHPDARGAYSAIEQSDGTVKHVPDVVVANPLAFILVNTRPPTLPSALLVERDVLLDCPPRRTMPHEDLCGLVEILLRTPLAYVDEPLTVRNTPPRHARSSSSRERLVAAHERYAGLREQLLDDRLQRVAARSYRELVRSRDSVESTDGSGHEDPS